MASKAKAQQGALMPEPEVNALLPQPWWRKALREPIALGMVPMILVRPWLDGATYPTDNFYFVWVTLLLACLFLSRMLMRGAEPRFRTGSLLLAGFWLVGLLTLSTTIYYDLTYRAVIIWAGNLFLFIALVNGVRSRTAIEIVTGALITIVLAESVYSLIHYRYILPVVRQSLLADPIMLKAKFGTDFSNVALIHRLQINRAFGSFLFPNALAAFLILSLPLVFTEAMDVLRGFKKLSIGTSRPSQLPALLLVGFIWLLSTCVGYFVVSFVGILEYPLPQGLGRFGPLVYTLDKGGYRVGEFGYAFPWILFVLIVPVLLAAGAALILNRRGYAALWLAVRTLVLPILFVVQSIALWLTYSRGGMLGLFVALAFCAGLLIWSRRSNVAQRVASHAAAGLLLAFVLGGLVAQGPAQNPPGAINATPGGSVTVTPTAPAPAAPAPGAPAAPAAQQPQAPITAEGVNLKVSDLANTATLSLRVTYWQTGLKMAMHNLLTGVGLGNFGIAYPNYKAPTAGEVTAAHNDYLQALCETGILGFVLFCSFWGYIIVWGARRILAEQDRRERVILLGLYAGLLAFLAHSLIDFNFFNPSLCFFAFLIAGLLVSRALLREWEANPVETCRPKYQVIALPALLAVALVAGMAFRVYLSDFIVGGAQYKAVGDDAKCEQIAFEMETYFPPLNAEKAKKPQPLPLKHMGGLIPHRGVLEGFGKFLVRTDKPNEWRALRPDEPLNINAIYVVSDKEKAKQESLKYVDEWLAMLQKADAIYPHNAKLSGYFVRLYDLLVFSLPDGPTRQKYVVDYLKWAQETARRSPREFQYQSTLGKALWLRANLEPDTAARQRYFTQGLDAYKRAMELYPASADVTRSYATSLIKYGKALVSEATAATAAGVDPNMGPSCIKQGEDLLRHADELAKLRAQVAG